MSESFLQEWLHDHGRLPQPAILPQELREQFPIPEWILKLREERRATMGQAPTEADQFVQTHLNELRKCVHDLELSIITQRCLQNAGIEYVWQLCQCTAAELSMMKGPRGRILNDIKEVLAEMGLQIGMRFSQESLTLLCNRS